MYIDRHKKMDASSDFRFVNKKNKIIIIKKAIQKD